jgi:hypothetical protein
MCFRLLLGIPSSVPAILTNKTNLERLEKTTFKNVVDSGYFYKISNISRSQASSSDEERWNPFSEYKNDSGSPRPFLADGANNTSINEAERMRRSTIKDDRHGTRRRGKQEDRVISPFTLVTISNFECQGEGARLNLNLGSCWVFRLKKQCYAFGYILDKFIHEHGRTLF